MTVNLETQAILDALGQGVLIFDNSGKLVQYNMMAGTILGTDLNVIKTQGWTAAVELFDTGLQAVDTKLADVKDQAMHSARPIRFKIYRSGAYVPCWAAAINQDGGEVFTMLTMDIPDWELVSNVIDRFRNEMHDAVDSTSGHMRLIVRALQVGEDIQDPAATKIARRIGGFTRLVEIHMDRAGRLIRLLDRLQDVRTGKVRDNIKDTRKKITIREFLEDFVEVLSEVPLLDPESENHDYRARISLDVHDDLDVNASAPYLNSALREILRNAIMYSLVGTPVIIKANKKGHNIQIDIVDEGYGVRPKEQERVFTAFSRARQPQIISEFGYGLALYLCKVEIESMHGRLWFTSEENVGTTFSIMLPEWKETEAPSSSEKSAS